MNSETNPYSQPISEESPPQVSETPQLRGLDFVPIMYRWERLRLIYNGALIVIVILLTLIARPRNLLDVDFLFMLCIGGLFANLCFLLGPAIEAYGTHFRLWRGFMTSLLFVAGLILTAILAAACVLTYPDFSF